MTPSLKTLLFAALAPVSVALADVTLPAMFADHAVLQMAPRVPVWGQATPGEAVTVTFDNLQARTTAGADGRWRVSLDLSTKGPGPYELVVQGKNRLVFKDVLVGEVWLLSGQSNMGLYLAETAGAGAEIARSANPWIRELRTQVTPADAPADDVRSRHGKWQVAGPQTAGTMGGVGYYFAKMVSKELGRPVGLLHASAGGTPIEPWISIGGLNTHPVLREGAARAEDAVMGHPRRQADYARALADWQARHGREDARSADVPAFALAEADVPGWRAVSLPGSAASAGLPDAGVAWLRRTVEIRPERGGKHHYLYLPLLGQNYAAVYWDGELIGETTAATPQPHNSRRVYNIINTRARTGVHTLTIRLSNPVGGLALDKRARFMLSQGSNNTNLAGDWLATVEKAFPPLGAAELDAAPRPPAPPPYGIDQAPGRLFNGMIAPLSPYALRGVLWWQGESNGRRGWQYREAFSLLIQDWRRQFGRSDLPFYWCQLPNHGRKETQPGETGVADLRESQSLALALPHTGQAVLIDSGDADDVHGGNKKDPGERLARIALAKTYGRDVPWSGPVYESMRVEGDVIRLRFEHLGGGLVARPLPATYPLKYTHPDKPPQSAPLVPTSPGSELQGFAICGADQRWVWAQASIEGDEVRVWSPEVPEPVAVRYAWARNPTCNLYGRNGLPASPFRTDVFPLGTQEVVY